MADFNLDARQEVRLENDRLIAYVRPALGGHIYELDVRHAQASTSSPRSTAGPRPTTAPSPPPRPPAGSDDRAPAPPSILDHVVLKQDDLDQRPRLRPPPPQVARRSHLSRSTSTPGRPHRLPRCRARRLRDRHVSLARSSARSDRGLRDHASSRPRRRATRSRSARRSSWRQRSETLDVRLRARRAAGRRTDPLRGRDSTWPRWPATPMTATTPIPRRPPPGDARRPARPGESSEGLTLTDEWLDLADRPTLVPRLPGLWCFPIETVSQSEGGFEGRLPVVGGDPPLAGRHRRRIPEAVGGPDPLDPGTGQLVDPGRRPGR